MTPQRGKFVVFDGMDGSGKGTQIKLLHERLVGIPVCFTREPGGTPRAELIRELILKDPTKSTALCDFFLFWAARASHIEEVVSPALRRGEHVISDRYDSSTWAFQIRGEEYPDLIALYSSIRSHLIGIDGAYEPDTYLFFDLPAEVAYERSQADTMRSQNRFDLKPLEYHERVRNGFREFAKDRKSAFIIDANRSVEAIHEDVWQIVGVQLGI